MKRRDLIRHLETYGCEFLREGGNHTIYVNRVHQKSSAIPRHREINEFLTGMKKHKPFPQLVQNSTSFRLVEITKKKRLKILRKQLI